MTRPIGFSTGALALGDFRRGLRMLHGRRLPVVELSALRDHELEPLLSALDSLDLAVYSYVSLHAPSRFTTLSARQASTLLRQLLPRRWPIIFHPDALTDYAHWQGFGEWLCVENMDTRKSTGRTARELEPVFEALPDASLCFDIGHARQVDPTMTEAALILRRYGHRLKQVHLSEVNAGGGHDPLSSTAVQSFRKVADLIPPTVPIVLETAVPEEQLVEQLQLAAAIFGRPGTVG